MLLLLQGKSGTELVGAAVPAIWTDACCKVCRTLTELRTALFKFVKMRESLQTRAFNQY